jgi:hypothetical protein
MICLAFSFTKNLKEMFSVPPVVYVSLRSP